MAVAEGSRWSDFEDRNQEGEGLAAGGAGHRDHVFASAGGGDGLGLVGVEPLDGERGERLAQERRKRRIEIGVARFALGEALHVRDLSGVVAFGLHLGEPAREVVAEVGAGHGRNPPRRSGRRRDRKQMFSIRAEARIGQAGGRTGPRHGAPPRGRPRPAGDISVTIAPRAVASRGLALECERHAADRARDRR